MNIRIKDCLIVSRPSKPDTPIDDDQLCSIAFLCGDDVTAKAADIADAGHDHRRYWCKENIHCARWYKQLYMSTRATLLLM
ncbi:hypothetical protein BDV3_007280 [Batrachochytrium dendrobatidis]